MITNRENFLQLSDALTELKIIIEDKHKINDNKMGETKETEETTENILK